MRRRYRRINVGSIEVHIDNGPEPSDNIVEVEIPGTDRTAHRARREVHERVKKALYEQSKRSLK